MQNIKNIFSSLSPLGKVGVALLFLFASCKSPVPVYFDNPIGTKMQGFDTVLAGNYLPLDDILDKSTREFSDKYILKYDKIVLKDTNTSFEASGKDINYDEIKNLIGNGKDSTRTRQEIKCDSSIVRFNELAVINMGENEESSKDVAGIIKIMYDKVISISIDSAGTNHYDTLVRLDSKTILTKYSGNYFLNIKTSYGWEILQMEMWEGKFLSARPFYFTDYDGCAQTVAALTASTKNIYPDLKPIVLDKKVIGFRAIMNPKFVLEAFKKVEEPMLLLKMKR